MKKCKKCGRCCRRFEVAFDLNAEKNKPIIEAFLKRLKRDTGVVEIKELQRMAIVVYGECIYLDKKNRCKIYKKRPLMCKNYYCDDLRKV